MIHLRSFWCHDVILYHIFNKLLIFIIIGTKLIMLHSSKKCKLISPRSMVQWPFFFFGWENQWFNAWRAKQWELIKKKKHTVLHVCPPLWICDNLLRPESHPLDLIKIVVYFCKKIYFIYIILHIHIFKTPHITSDYLFILHFIKMSNFLFFYFFILFLFYNFFSSFTHNNHHLSYSFTLKICKERIKK